MAHTLFTIYRQRSLVGLVLMVAQAFFYNAIFFTFALVLTDFFGIPSNHVGWYILPFAAGNFLGPLLLGRLFDTLGRRTMIALTYGVSGVLLALSGYLFSIGVLTRADPDHRLDGDLLLCLAGGERGLSHRQRDVSAGGARAGDCAVLCDRNRHRRRGGPALFGVLIDTGSRNSVFAGYLFGSALMIVAAAVAWRYAIAAERKSLEICRTAARICGVG